MWIRELPEDYYEHPSFCYDSVMLWQNGNVFVMDNHLSAAWCWIQCCDSKEKYNFMHIDRHYDMLACFWDEDLLPLRMNPHMTYDEFKNLQRTKDEYETYPVFRWDNYIMAIYQLYPEWFHSNIFMTHKEGDKRESWNHNPFDIYEEEPIFMDSVIDQYIGEANKYLAGFETDDYKLPWIVNLDLDVFFNCNDPHVQLFSDDYIRLVARVLNRNIGKIHSLTIAISPDCLGGNGMKEKWDNGFHVLKIMSEELECLRVFPFPKSV